MQSVDTKTVTESKEEAKENDVIETASEIREISDLESASKRQKLD